MFNIIKTMSALIAKLPSVVRQVTIEDAVDNVLSYCYVLPAARLADTRLFCNNDYCNCNTFQLLYVRISLV